MKKFIFFMLLTTALFACQRKASAQSLIKLYSGSAIFDTLTNTGTVSFKTLANAISANRTGGYAVQFKATAVSGTQTYKAIYKGSLDGTNWFPFDTVQVTAGVPSFWVARISEKWRFIGIDFKGDSSQKTRFDSLYLINE